MTIATHIETQRPLHRLSPKVRDLAARALAGEHGRVMRNATFGLDLDDAGELSENRRYALAAQAIAEQAPLRVLDGEAIIGSATLLEAANHLTPILGSHSTSHVTLGWKRVLDHGYVGLRRQIEERLAQDGSSDGALDAQGVDLLEAMLGCLDAAEIWRQRHLALLDERIATSHGEVQSTYRLVREALAQVPEYPARTFHEALQSLWFQHAFQRLCGNWSGIGRIDELLGPYLSADLAAGRITLDEARELLAHFWIKGCEWIGADTRHVGASGDGQFYQNVILSGIDRDGHDITNDVTYLVLDVVEELRISDFPIAVRINERTSERLLRRIAEVQRLGSGTVAIYGEETILRALERFGYTPEEARQFANDGCWEIVLPGQSTFSYYPFDALQLLQEVLGVIGDGPPPTYETFEELYAAFRERLGGFLTDWHRRADDWSLGGRAAPLASLLVDDCIARGHGYHDRGSRYNVYAPHAGGLPDVVNSLLAIKQLVYEEHMLSLAELVEVLRQDWQDHEVLRRRMRSGVVWYGNDDSQADSLYRRVFDDYVALAGAVRERAGVLRPPGVSTFGRQIEWAPKRGATAAGGQAGDVLANNLSPSPGSDRHGPTAVIRSFCAVDFTQLPNGTALEIKLHPSSVQGEEGIDALVSLMRTFAHLGGIFLHIDVVDSALLREAQRDPDRYPHLSVRVSGWSARFATLSREWQDMIIARTEHAFR
jgi:pyruvate-formate lyase